MSALGKLTAYINNFAKRELREERQREIDEAGAMFGIPPCPSCRHAYATNEACQECLAAVVRLQGAIHAMGVSAEEAARRIQQAHKYLDEMQGVAVPSNQT